MEKLYTGIANSTGARLGHIKTSDGVIDFNLSKPKGLGGEEKPGTTNPEQLFACAYAACFGGAIAYIAQLKKHSLKDINVTAEISIEKEGEGLKLSAELKVSLPELNHEQAEEIVKAAHQACPYSKATRGNIDVKLTVL